MQLKGAVKVREVVEARESRDFDNRAVGGHQQHSSAVKPEIVYVADKGGVHKLLKEVRYIVAADAGSRGDLVEREAVGVMLVDVVC